MNTEIKLLPCPFCGSSNVDAEGWVSTDRSGPACDDCSGSADTVALWNSRPSPGPHSDATCYIERSAAREILICVADEDKYLAEILLAEIDRLPIFTAADLRTSLTEV